MYDGVTLGYIYQFIEDHNGRDGFLGLTTEDVCIRYVLPFTSTTKLSFVEHVRSISNGKYVKPATWFVSHTWSYKFLDVIDALTHFFQENNLPNDIAIWFCMFNNNQHEIQNVMIFSPWNNPITLQRTWCVFEVYMSVLTNARFEIAMTRKEKNDFFQQVPNGTLYDTIFGHINSKNSTTTVPTDQIDIFKVIESEIGFIKLDRMIFQVLDRWVMNTIDNKIESIESNDMKIYWLTIKGNEYLIRGDYNRCLTTLEVARNVVPSDTVDGRMKYWRTETIYYYTLSCMYRPHDEWLNQLEQLVEIQVNGCGDEHHQTNEARDFLASAYCYIGELDQSLNMHMKCFDINKRLLGQYHGNTLMSMQHIGSILSKQLKLQQAIQCYNELIDCRSHSLGIDHSETNQSRLNLGTCLNKQGKFRQALDITEVVYTYRLRIEGAQAIAVNMCLCNMGVYLRNLGRLAEAEKVIKESLEIFIKHESNYWILNAKRQLAMVYLCEGNPSLAAACIEPLLNEYKSTFGASHWEYKTVLGYLYFIELAFSPTTRDMASWKRLETELKAAGMWHETWPTHSCHACYKPIHGDLFMCTACPTYSLRYCNACAHAVESDLGCHHENRVWTIYNPPARFVLEKLLELSVEGVESKDHDTYKEKYKSYCEEHDIQLDQSIHSS